MVTKTEDIDIKIMIKMIKEMVEDFGKSKEENEQEMYRLLCIAQNRALGPSEEMKAMSLIHILDGESITKTLDSEEEVDKWMEDMIVQKNARHKKANELYEYCTITGGATLRK